MKQELKKTIGIIGGTGKMGSWFSKFFSRKGYKVQVSGRTTSLSIRDCAKTSDIVIVSVPIGQTISIIREIAPLVKEDGLLMDFTSIKQAPIEAMLAHSRSAVIGLHPMFGAGVKALKNQTIVICPARPRNYLPWIRDLLVKDGGIIKIITPEQHDRMMAVIQGLLHFSSISICHSLRKLGTPMSEMEKLSSPIFRLSMDVVGRILNQDGNLYADIELLNPFVVETLKTYITDAQSLLAMIEQKDKAAFLAYFDEAADYLGNFKKESEYYTDSVIEFLVDKGRRR
ncbi:prephenate dehydrogenase/arogenate dehydrogenase family protein [Candidatus Woesearchaeota archaeon]|nr:prephenate dehydrogenase/arogenate dehydrogenase family protein [Candidatus Woesearchaeota archaeon]